MNSVVQSAILLFGALIIIGAFLSMVSSLQRTQANQMVSASKTTKTVEVMAINSDDKAGQFILWLPSSSSDVFISCNKITFFHLNLQSDSAINSKTDPRLITDDSGTIVKDILMVLIPQGSKKRVELKFKGTGKAICSTEDFKITDNLIVFDPNLNMQYTIETKDPNPRIINAVKITKLDFS